jgi:hypothetical protein
MSTPEIDCVEVALPPIYITPVMGWRLQNSHGLFAKHGSHLGDERSLGHCADTSAECVCNMHRPPDCGAASISRCCNLRDILH